MRVGICDFPSTYAFPPYGYGGIERWLWAAAIGARRAGSDVVLLGPQWRTDLDEGWVRHPLRLEELTDVAALRRMRLDLLVVGHEYPSLPAWRIAFEQLDCDVATFQHWPYFAHQADAFDGHRTRLYCYSTEMLERYSAHKPYAELAVHLGFGEVELPARDGRDLVWLGRIDEQKAPHLAIQAAARAGRRIRIVGPVFDHDYVNRHAHLFTADHVEMVGEVGGAAKATILRDAAALVYTAGRGYIEAGAAVFGEALRAGTPVAALTWGPGTCADAALCADTGSIVQIDPDTPDDDAAEALAQALGTTTALRAADVQEIGQSRFDPIQHFRALAARP